jgi:hypothetical protein
MTGFRRTARWIVPLVLLSASAAVSLSVVARRGGPGSSAESRGPGAFLLGEVSRHPEFSFGFRNLLSDILWLEAVQVSGSKVMTRAHYDRLVPLLDAVVNFDPRFRVAYLLGGLFVTESKEHGLPAVRLLDRGREAFPGDWRFPFYIGYTRYFSLGQPVEAGRSMMDASRLPGSPEYLPRLAARMLAEGRDPETALSFLRLMVAQETDPDRRAILMRRARDLAVERDLQRIDRALEAYRSRNGRPPGNLESLVREGDLDRIPEEPNGGRYGMAPDGTAYSTSTRERVRVLRNQR